MAKAFDITYSQEQPPDQGPAVAGHINFDNGAQALWGQVAKSGDAVFDTAMQIQKKLQDASDMVEIDTLRRKRAEKLAVLQQTMDSNLDPEGNQKIAQGVMQEIADMQSPNVRVANVWAHEQSEAIPQIGEHVQHQLFKQRQTVIEADYQQNYDAALLSGDLKGASTMNHKLELVGLKQKGWADSQEQFIPAQATLVQAQRRLESGTAADLDDAKTALAGLDDKNMTPEQQDTRYRMLRGAHSKFVQTQKQNYDESHELISDVMNAKDGAEAGIIADNAKKRTATMATGKELTATQREMLDRGINAALKHKQTPEPREKPDQLIWSKGLTIVHDPNLTWAQKAEQISTPEMIEGTGPEYHTLWNVIAEGNERDAAAAKKAEAKDDKQLRQIQRSLLISTVDKMIVKYPDLTEKVGTVKDAAIKLFDAHPEWSADDAMPEVSGMIAGFNQQETAANVGKREKESTEQKEIRREAGMIQTPGHPHFAPADKGISDQQLFDAVNARTPLKPADRNPTKIAEWLAGATDEDKKNVQYVNIVNELIEKHGAEWRNEYPLVKAVADTYPDQWKKHLAGTQYFTIPQKVSDAIDKDIMAADPKISIENRLRKYKEEKARLGYQ